MFHDYKMDTYLPEELYFDVMSPYLDTMDFFTLCNANRQFELYNNLKNWIKLLYNKYPKYHKLIIFYYNMNALIIKQILYILDIMSKDDETQRINDEEKKKKKKEKTNKNRFRIYEDEEDNIKVIKFIEKEIDLHKLLTYSCKHECEDLTKFLIENVDRAVLFVNYEPLNEACKNSNIEIVDIIYNTTKDIERTQNDHNYSYYYSCLHGNTEFMTYIFNRLLNELSVRNKNIGDLKALCPPKETRSVFGKNSMSDPIVKSFDSLLGVACKGGNLDTVKLFLEHMKLPVQTIDSSLVTAAKHGKLSIVKYFMEDNEVKQMRDKLYGDEDDIKYTYKNVEKSGKRWVRYINSSFSVACSKGHYDVMIYLLNSPNVNVEDVKQFAFISACQNGHTKLVKYLLTTTVFKAKGVIDPSFNNSEALHGACMNRHYKIIEMLLKDGRSDPLSVNQSNYDDYDYDYEDDYDYEEDKKEETNKRCLTTFCRNYVGNDKCLLLLLQDERVKEYLKTNDNIGNDLLYEACYLGNNKIIKILLDDPNITLSKMKKQDEIVDRIINENNYEAFLMLLSARENDNVKRIDISDEKITKMLESASYCNYSNVDYITPINKILDVIDLEYKDYIFEMDFIENICRQGLFDILKRLIENFDVEPTNKMLDDTCIFTDAAHIDQIEYLLKCKNIDPSQLPHLLLTHSQNTNTKVVECLIEDPRVIVDISFAEQATTTIIDCDYNDRRYHQKDDKRVPGDHFDMAYLLLTSKNFKYTGKYKKKMLESLRERATEYCRQDILDVTEKYLE